MPAPGRPPLHISFDGGGSLKLSGTGAPDDYILESTPTLAPADWQPLTATPVIDGDIFSYTLPPQGPRHFYRLRRK